MFQHFRRAMMYTETGSYLGRRIGTRLLVGSKFFVRRNGVKPWPTTIYVPINTPLL